MREPSVARIRFRPPLARSRKEMAIVVAGVAFWGFLVIHAVLAPSQGTITYGLVGLAFLAYYWRKHHDGVVADAVGMHRPFHRVLRWDRVEAIAEPNAATVELVLRCRDGNTRTTFLPPEYAEELSQISGTPIRSEKAPHPIPQVEARKAWQQEQDDFAARAARVRARNAELLRDPGTSKQASERSDE